MSNESMKTDRSSVLRFLLNGTLWSFIGVLLTIAFFYWAERRNPFDFTVSLDDVQNLVEVRERIPDLKILYRNQDILELKRNIKIARITLRNEGATLLQQHFDTLEPFGLRFPAATVLDYEMVESNSDYLTEHLLAQLNNSTALDQQQPEAQESSDFIPFQNVIFEEGKYATLRVYLLQDQIEEHLNIAPVGKIANIDSLRVVFPQTEEEGAGIPVFMVAFGFAYVGIIAGMLSLIGVMTWLDSSSKKRKIHRFLRKHGQLSAVESEIVSVYRNQWDATLRRILRGCARGDRVFDLREDLRKQIDDLTSRRSTLGWPIAKVMPSSARRLLRPRSLPTELFTCQGTEVSLNAETRDFALRFFSSVGEIDEDQERDAWASNGHAKKPTQGEHPAGGDAEDRAPQP